MIGTQKLNIISEALQNQTGISLDETISRNRRDDVCSARHILVFYLRREEKMSLGSIGAFLGNRKHTTLLSSYRKVVLDPKLRDMAFKFIENVSQTKRELNIL